MSSWAEVITMSNDGSELDKSKEKLSPWAQVSKSYELHSLEDVMSEQLAKELHEKETKINSMKEINNQLNFNESNDLKVLQAVNTTKEDACKDDFMLAQLLQLELDKEYDQVLKQHENLKNKNSRISISYDKFKTVHPLTEKDEKELNYLNEPEVLTSEESEDELSKLKFKRGVHGKGENMISKHDILLNNRRNAAKVMNFPPEFESGDSHGINMRLSNKVFNELKHHSEHLEKRQNIRLNDKHDKSTSEISLDPKTRLILFKLVNADIIDSIGGIVSTGKEATILHALGGKSQELLVPKECVAKVFKTTLNEFKTREKYIGDDYRFKDRYKHLNPQKIVKLWAEKEMHNLMKMKKFGIRCPDVVILKKHVLIMSFVGADNVPAPKLKDANLNQEDLKSAYEQSIKLIKDLYHACNLVHGDLNQFNLLWYENKIWVVDVSQSVEPIHPMGLEFLLRDCTNIYKFFTNRKLENVLTGEEIFNEVTNMNFKGEGQYFLSQIQKYTKDKQMELNSANSNEEKNPYNFDYYFERSKKNKEKSSSEDSEESDE